MLFGKYFHLSFLFCYYEYSRIMIRKIFYSLVLKQEENYSIRKILKDNNIVYRYNIKIALKDIKYM